MSRFAIVTHDAYVRHVTGRHPEHPDRLRAIWQALRGQLLPSGVRWLTPTPAEVEAIERVHDRSHVQFIRAMAEQGGGRIDVDTVVAPASYDTALLAAGGAIQAVDAVLDGSADSSFAIVRPPGHHATPNRAMGFCLFNNVAIAARHAVAVRGLSRVAIVDFDVHHGNGTQDVFQADPSVLFCSAHEYPLYPGTGAASETGAGPARGQTINIPLPAGCGDVVYDKVFDLVVGPAVRHFGPELILVSAGFDAHWADPLASMSVSTSGFIAMVRRLQEWASALCDGRLALVLEGGYDLTALGSSVRAVVEQLAGGTPIDQIGPPPGGAIENVDPLIDHVRLVHGLF